MIKWMCRAVMFLLLTTISISSVLLIDGKRWYYYAGLCVLMAVIGGTYGFIEIWFANRKEKVNPGHFNEAADRSACLAQMIMRVLLDHPAVQQSPDMRPLAEEAATKLLILSNHAATKGDKDIVINDRVWWFWESFDDLIVQNPIIAGDPEALKLADAAEDYLWKLYQHLGRE